MANSYVQVPTDSTGKKLQTFQNTVGGNVVEGQGAVLVDSAGAPLVAQKTMANSLPIAIASDQSNIPISGGTLATTSGTLTTSTSTVTTGDVALYNNVTVVLAGTYAGVNATFEVSPDAGTTWVPIVGSRIDGTGTESTTSVLAANTVRGWEFTLPAVNRFRVRATAYTSGTANVIIAAGTMPLEPVVNAITTKAPGNVQTVLSTATAGVTGVTTEALITMVPTRAGTSGSTATTFSPTAGKTFKIQNLSVTVAASTAAVQAARFYLRGVPTGTASATSPILAIAGTNTIAAVIGAQNTANIPLDMDIPPGWSIGLTQVATLASGTVHATIQGYEY